MTADIFWYRDGWYRSHTGKWYKAKHHNGPWYIIHKKHVPRAVIGIPPTYRVSTRRYEKLSYQEVQRHHRAWEKNRHWDKIENQNRGKGETPRDNGGRKNDRGNDRHKPGRDNHKGR